MPRSIRNFAHHAFTGIHLYCERDRVQELEIMITRNTIVLRAFAAAITVMLLIAAAGAQTNSSAVERTSARAAQPNAEVTISGTVDGFHNRSDLTGGPMGAHLLVRVSGGSVDAHLGPFFSRNNSKALIAGEAVEAIGMWTNIHGREVLLVRQLRVGDRTITVRNERGFPLTPPRLARPRMEAHNDDAPRYSSCSRRRPRQPARFLRGT